MTLLGARRRPPPDEYWNAARGRCQPRPAGLRLGGDWRKKLAESENDREPDPPHEHLVWDGWRESSRPELRATCGLPRPADELRLQPHPCYSPITGWYASVKRTSVGQVDV